MRQDIDGDKFADLDGKRIYLKSVFDAHVTDDKDVMKMNDYKSRIAHCGSCLSEKEDGYGGLDDCCCVHSHFNSKKDENDYVKSLGFWKLSS